MELTRQDRIWPNRTGSHRFQITNDLLFNCISYRAEAASTEIQLTGFSDGKCFGYALLMYFASLALEFRRLPFCEDRVYSHYSYDLQIKAEESEGEVLRSLNDETVQEIVKELRDLYAHTQTELEKAGLKKVRLNRKIYNNGDQYASSIIKIAKLAEMLGEEEVRFEMDTLNSFGDDDSYHDRWCVAIEHDFDARDILYCSSLIENRDAPATEYGEWIVINRDPAGVVNFPISSIIPKHCWQTNMSEDCARKYFDNFTPFVLRNNFRLSPTYNGFGVKMSTGSLVREVGSLVKEIAYRCLFQRGRAYPTQHLTNQ